MPVVAYSHLREHWRNLTRGRPGHRFRDRYERARRAEAGQGAVKRILLLIAALACFSIGAVLVVIPGPAFVFFILGGGLLATESRVVARFMDWSELRIRHLVDAVTRLWHRLPVAGRIGLVVFVLGVGGAAAVFLFQLLWD